MIRVKKRDNAIVDFDKTKIEKAITLAMKSPQGKEVKNQAQKIAEEIELELTDRDVVDIAKIESLVFYKLISKKNKQTAKAYEGYKEKQKYRRLVNTTDTSINGLLDLSNRDIVDENSNKNAKLVSTQRDLIAGEVSKDIAKRKILDSDLLEAHESGAIHIHDTDYLIQKEHNCSLLNIRDMLENGTVINDTMIEVPKSLKTAATVTTQISASVSSSQYGGQSIELSHLAPFVDVSRKKIKRELLEDFGDLIDNEELDRIVEKRLKKEIKDSVQTMNYQWTTLAGSNGQSPFITLFMYIEQGRTEQERKDLVLLIEEVLKQRLAGTKSVKGVALTPTFPKLIYVLDESNNDETKEYWYLTQLAAKCTAKRMYPDYISAKKMRELYDGNVFSPMGCRSFLTPYYEDGKAKFTGRFNQGVVTINLPQIALIVNESNLETLEEKESLFFEILDKRLELVKKALMLRHKLLLGTKSDVAPILWQNGAIARLEKGETIDKLLFGGYSTLSIGYIGLYEVSKLITNESHTKEKGYSLAIRIMNKLNEVKELWTKQENIQFAVYGTPAESLTHRFCKIDKERFGIVKDITDKGYYTNSYHVDVREHISVFDKFLFEQKFQELSTGGMISYVEIANLNKNLKAVETMIKFIYDNITYGEFNTKSDLCEKCMYDEEISVNDKGEWECPVCGNTDRDTLNVIRRTCGYLGANFWNEGRTKEITSRVVHL